MKNWIKGFKMSKEDLVFVLVMLTIVIVSIIFQMLNTISLFISFMVLLFSEESHRYLAMRKPKSSEKSSLYVNRLIFLIFILSINFAVPIAQELFGDSEWIIPISIVTWGVFFGISLSIYFFIGEYLVNGKRYSGQERMKIYKEFLEREDFESSLKEREIAIKDIELTSKELEIKRMNIKKASIRKYHKYN